MATKASITKAKYDSVHCTGVYLKLNLKTDSDILEKLDSVPNRQGYIKQLIREDISRTCPVPISSAPKKKMSLNDIYSFIKEQADIQPEEYDGIYDMLNCLVGKHMGYTPDR